MKKFWIRTAIVLGALALLVFGLVTAAGIWTERQLAALDTRAVDPAQVADGVDPGEAQAGPVLVRVSVTVKDHALQAVELLEHQNGKGQAAEVLPLAMVAHNTAEVDAVSGATYSSKVLKAAVRQALRQGLVP